MTGVNNIKILRLPFYLAQFI